MNQQLMIIEQLIPYKWGDWDELQRNWDEKLPSIS